MLSNWFSTYIFSGNFAFDLGPNLTFYIYPATCFAGLMFVLTIWAAFHLVTDIIMAFRAVFGFGYKKRKGGSH